MCTAKSSAFVHTSARAPSAQRLLVHHNNIWQPTIMPPQAEKQKSLLLKERAYSAPAADVVNRCEGSGVTLKR